MALGRSAAGVVEVHGMQVVLMVPPFVDVMRVLGWRDGLGETA